MRQKTVKKIPKREINTILFTDFERAIEEFLKICYDQREKKKRREIALKNSWEEKLKNVCQIVDSSIL